MIDKFKITEAISFCNVCTGVPIRTIEKDLAAALWPNSSEEAQRQNLYHLKSGRVERLTIQMIQIIHEVTRFDANSLCGIEI